MLGAGGSARAAAAALLRAGTRSITVVARRLETADRLADALAELVLRRRGRRRGGGARRAGGLLVHCTPVGGIAALKQLPVPADVIERMDAVADFAYRADGSPTPLAEAGAGGRPTGRRRPRAARAPGRPVVPSAGRASSRRSTSCAARRGANERDRRRARRRRRRAGRTRLGAARAAADRALEGRRGAARAAALDARGHVPPAADARIARSPAGQPGCASARRAS